jgi:hypothetical protein
MYKNARRVGNHIRFIKRMNDGNVDFLPAINIFISCCLLLWLSASVGLRWVCAPGSRPRAHRNKTVHLLLSPLSETIFTPAAARREYISIFRIVPRLMLSDAVCVFYIFSLWFIYARESRLGCRCMTLFAASHTQVLMATSIHPPLR